MKSDAIVIFLNLGELLLFSSYLEVRCYYYLLNLKSGAIVIFLNWGHPLLLSSYLKVRCFYYPLNWCHYLHTLMSGDVSGGSRGANPAMAPHPVWL